VSDFLRGVLALRKKDIVAGQKARAAAAPADDAEDPPFDADPALPPAAPLDSREAIAKAARLSSSQVVMIEKIQKQAAPELVAAVKSGTISINAAAAVATLPAEEQIAAANGGKDELKQAAKRVREARRPARAEAAGAQGAAEEPDAVTQLTRRVAELTAENDDLRRRVAALQALLQAAEA
jgi:hypothetical protein